MGRRAIAALALALCAAAGCGAEDNPLFCDATHPCTVDGRPFCDIQGVYPASEGVRNTCIPDPFDEPPDAGESDGPIGGPDGGPDAAVVIDAAPDAMVDYDAAWCSGPADCTTEVSPICDQGNGMCRGCDSFGECEGADPSRPLCAPDGRCVACLDSTDDCTTATAPICDGDDGDCRACAFGGGGDAECNGRSVLTPFCGADGACAECLQSDQCAIEIPICDAAGHTCRACDAATGDADCAARDPFVPYCRTALGTCSECLTDADCGPAEPVCDLLLSACRACRADLECASEVCNESTGACVAPADIIYVATTGTDGPTCGLQGSPCETIGNALAKVGGVRRTLKVRGGEYTEAVSISALQVTIVATGATVNPPGSNVAALAVTAGSDVTVEGMTMTGANGTGDGASCTSASLRLLDVTVTSNDDLGVDAFTCPLTIESSVISENGGGGVRITGSSFSLLSNFITGNGDIDPGGSAVGGVSISNTGALAPQMFAFNTVAANRARAAATASGVSCIADPPVTATSNIVYDGIGGMANVAGDCPWTFSDIQGLVAGMGNFDGDPVFVDDAGGDYHIQGTSPCRNAGNPAGGASTDIDGQDRPLGSGFDCGADEIP